MPFGDYWSRYMDHIIVWFDPLQWIRFYNCNFNRSVDCVLIKWETVYRLIYMLQHRNVFYPTIFTNHCDNRLEENCIIMVLRKNKYSRNSIFCHVIYSQAIQYQWTSMSPGSMITRWPIMHVLMATEHVICIQRCIMHAEVISMQLLGSWVRWQVCLISLEAFYYRRCTPDFKWTIAWLHVACNVVFVYPRPTDFQTHFEFHCVEFVLLQHTINYRLFIGNHESIMTD